MALRRVITPHKLLLRYGVTGVVKQVGLDQLENPLPLNLEVKGSILTPYKRSEVLFYLW